MECNIMAERKFSVRDYHSPARISKGDRGAIWKCYDLQRNPVGYLVATGESCNKPIAYIGITPGVLPAAAPRAATLQPVGFNGERMFTEATAIAADFSKAKARNVVDLRHVSLKNFDTFPHLLRILILKPTNGSERAIRYGFVGAIYRPFRTSPREKMGVALFHATQEEGLVGHEREWESRYINAPMIPTLALLPGEHFVPLASATA
jgi:hypothetical protein